jgi:hypothetical protein
VGLFGTLFGKPGTSTSKSWNDAAPWANQTFQPAAQAGVGGINQLAGELDGGFDDYAKNAGWDFQLGEGLDGITGSAAARGLLRSGSAGKAFVKYGNDLKGGMYNNYLGQLGNLGQLGLGTGGLLANFNQRNEGVSKGATDGLLGKIGQAAGMFASFSDRRLKTDIEPIGADSDGLGRYRYRYLWEDETREGVMADEVATVRPWALGPVVDGFATVNYGAL